MNGNMKEGEGGSLIFVGFVIFNVCFLNWKIRLCNKWEIIGYCFFEDKCYFVYGLDGKFVDKSFL